MLILIIIIISSSSICIFAALIQHNIITTYCASMFSFTKGERKIFLYEKKILLREVFVTCKLNARDEV